MAGGIKAKRNGQRFEYHIRDLLNAAYSPATPQWKRTPMSGALTGNHKARQLEGDIYCANKPSAYIECKSGLRLRPASFHKSNAQINQWITDLREHIVKNFESEKHPWILIVGVGRPPKPKKKKKGQPKKFFREWGLIPKWRANDLEWACSPPMTHYDYRFCGEPLDQGEYDNARQMIYFPLKPFLEIEGSEKYFLQ